MFKELKEKLDELKINYCNVAEGCITIARDNKTRMAIMYDKKYGLCAFYIKNVTKDTIGMEDNLSKLITTIARYYEGEVI